MCSSQEAGGGVPRSTSSPVPFPSDEETVHIMGLNREQRRQLLAQEIDGTETTVESVDAVDTSSPSAVAAPVAVGVDAQTIAQIVAATVAAMRQASIENVGDAVAQAIRDNRKPMPENTDAEYHGRSHVHPEGKDAPRPTLDVETWCGSWDHESGKASPKWRYDETSLRDDEIRTLNELPVGEYRMERLDGTPIVMRVVDVVNALGERHRRVICYPKQQFQKEHANQLPDLKAVRRQVVTVA